MNYTRKMVKMVNFMLCYTTQKKQTNLKKRTYNIQLYATSTQLQICCKETQLGELVQMQHNFAILFGLIIQTGDKINLYLCNLHTIVTKEKIPL